MSEPEMPQPPTPPIARRLLRLAVAALAVLTAPPLPAQDDVTQAPTPDRPQPPPYYAIENARIVTGTGETIERGTIVLADGLVEAVGAGAEVPPDAWVIDAEGLTVYPGLFDALSEVGLEGGDEGSSGGGGGNPFQRGSGDPIEGPEDRPATHPAKAAAEHLDADADAIETWREGGWTSALVAPAEGLVAGQGAVVALAGEESEMVVAAPAALRLGFEAPGGFRSFPSSLFGAMSYLEQLFADAERHAAATADYRDDPRGKKRPVHDPTLEPIHRAVAEGWAILLPGNDAKEIRRAVALGERLGGRTVVFGGQGAWETAGELAAAGVPVLVDLDWPEANRDADPEREESLLSLVERANAPTTPAALEAAGAPWAFYSGGTSTPREALEKAREAIEAGLSPEAALAGLTRGPAEIYGLADRLGTLEPGKIANLVVTDGDLFAEGTKVKMTFVDGRKFEIREEDRPEEPPAGDLTGRWELTLESPRGTQEVTAHLEMDEDGSLSGTLVGSRGEVAITGGWVSGDRFSFTSTIEMGPRSMEVTYTGSFEGDELEGAASVGSRFSMDFRGTRSGPGAGGVR